MENQNKLKTLLRGALKGSHDLYRPMTQDISLLGTPRRGMDPAAGVEITAAKPLNRWHEDKFYRAAMGLVKHMRHQGITVQVGVNEPPYPRRNTLYVHVESGDPQRVPKKWERLHIELRGPLPCPTQPNQDLSEPAPAKTPPPSPPSQPTLSASGS